MNKNIKKMTVAMFAIGCLTVGSLGGLAYAAGNSYDNFKTAVVQTIKNDNMTVSATMEMKQDETVIAQGTTMMQKAGTQSYMLSNMTIGDQVMDTERSSNDGVAISRQGDQYFSSSIGIGDNKRQELQNSPNITKLMDMTSDLLVGDVKNQFVANGDTISLNLTDAQIPELANVAMAASTEMRGQHQADLNMPNVFPITQNSKIESINLNATVKDGSISAMDITVVMSGQNNDRQTVRIETTVKGTVSELGTTTPNQIDTTGKTVTEKTMEHWKQ